MRSLGCILLQEAEAYICSRLCLQFLEQRLVHSSKYIWDKLISCMHNTSHSSWYIGVFNKWKLLGLFPEFMEDRINQYNRQDFRL